VADERYALERRSGGEWEVIETGDHTGWMEDLVRDGMPSGEYRTYDTALDSPVSIWNGETETWTPSHEVTIEQFLHDEVTDTALTVKLHCTERGIELIAPGHGDRCSAEGHGTPVWIEFRDGELWVRVWGDIGSENPTHSIGLAGAREAYRDARPVFVVKSVSTQDGGTYHSFEPFLGKVGDRVIVADPDPSDRCEGTIVEIVPAQAGFNPPMVVVEDESGRRESVAIEYIEQVIESDGDADS
jgi:hypothetical protein